MKLFTLGFFSFLLSSFSFSQETSKLREVGLNLSGISSYGLQYKTGNGSSMWRYRLQSTNLFFGNQGKTVSFNFNGNARNNPFQLNFSAAIGCEKRKEIAPNFQFVYGMELLAIYGYSRFTFGNNINFSTSIGGGITGVIGVRLDINERFFVGTELLPSATYQRSESTNNSNTTFPIIDTRFAFGFNSTSALVSFGIKF